MAEVVSYRNCFTMLLHSCLLQRPYACEANKQKSEALTPMEALKVLMPQDEDDNDDGGDDDDDDDDSDGGGGNGDDSDDGNGNGDGHGI